MKFINLLCLYIVNIVNLTFINIIKTTVDY